MRARAGLEPAQPVPRGSRPRSPDARPLSRAGPRDSPKGRGGGGRGVRQEWWGANRRWQCVLHFSASFDPTWNARLHGEDGSRRAGKSASLQRCSTEPPPVTVTVTGGGPSPGPDATFPAPPTPLFPPDAHAHAHRQLRMRKLTFLPLLLLPFSFKKKKKRNTIKPRLSVHNIWKAPCSVC